MKRLNDSSDVPESRLGILLKHVQSQRKRQCCILLSAEEWVLPVASTKEPEEREFVVDSGASMHMVSKKDLNSAELETMRTSRNPTTVMTAKGEVQTREEATVHVTELDSFVTVMLLEETLAVLSLGKLCKDHGFSYHRTSGQKPHITQNGKRIDCNISNYVPSVVPGLSTSSNTTSTPTSSTSSSQDSVFDVSRYTENPVPKEVEVRVKSYGESRCINQQKPRTQMTMEEVTKYSAIYCMPDWLQEFRENLVDERSPPEQR